PDTLRIEINERSELLLGAPKGGKLDPTLSNLGLIARTTAYNPWAKNYFGIRIIPKPDKWYGIELVDDPRGLTKQIRTINSLCPNPPSSMPITCSGGTSTAFYPSFLEQTTTERVLKFSAYIAKRYGPISGRFGLIENTGGFGIKLHLFNDSLTLSADAFEFANPLKARPRIKLYADFRFLDHLLITAGADDVANAPFADPEYTTRIISGRDYFLGAGFFFTDDDIKLLVAALPIRF